MAEEKNKKEEVKKEEKETEKKEEEKVEVPEKFKKLIKEIEEMSVLDLAELVKILEDKFGVSAAPQVVAGAAAGGAAAGGEEKEEKSAYNIVISELGGKKIQVIKAIRDVTKKGLKDSKALADAIASEPQTIKEGVEKEEAEEIKKKFEEAGAKVELK
jgi:large subunit ribosomal protein L7/L12